MELHVVVSRKMSGRKAVGVFSSAEKAQEYMNGVVEEYGPPCQHENYFIKGDYGSQDHVYMCHFYDPHDDVYSLQGAYSERSLAEDAARRGGQVIIDFEIDTPGSYI